MKMKSLFAAAALATCVVAGSANAANFVTLPGSAASFAPPSGDAVNTFNGVTPLAAGFTLTNSLASIITGSSPTSAQPAFSDGSAYLSVGAGGLSTLSGTGAYNTVSIFLGSIDSYNTISLLDTVGNVIASWPGWAFTTPANGDQVIPNTNRRITFSRGPGDAMIGGIRFASQYNSLEVDNVVFAVPEASTWVMMLLGFGLAGMAIRSRRRRTRVVFA
jgi:hypothetical protein